MPVHNADKLLEKTLNSFLNNLNNSVELIIIDDNSTDTSLKMLKDYEKKYDYIKIIHNEKNMGAGLSRNNGLAIARGKYIGFIDSDDYVDENYFQNMLDEAENNDCDIVVSDITLVYKNREEYGTIYKNNVYQNKNHTTNKCHISYIEDRKIHKISLEHIDDISQSYTINKIPNSSC